MHLEHFVIRPGRYVIAVSGGVDSMVLLNVMQQQPAARLTIAHFDHGIRQDSAEDRRLVQQAAAFYGLPFVYHEGQLGALTSEAAARAARYRFLQQVRQAAGAEAIITAHHQDDILETAILNMLRGTGRKGLSSLANGSDMYRPLLDISKNEIIQYAQNRDLIWREDSTNDDETYARNYVRHKLMPRFDDSARAVLLSLINDNRRINQALDQELIHQLHYQTQAHTLDKRWFASLPHAVAREVMATWLREHDITDFDRSMLERLTVKAKTQAAGQKIDIIRNHWLQINSDHLALARDER